MNFGKFDGLRGVWFDSDMHRGETGGLMCYPDASSPLTMFFMDGDFSVHIVSKVVLRENVSKGGRARVCVPSGVLANQRSVTPLILASHKRSAARN